MTQTNVSYVVSLKLKAFLGEVAPEPMGWHYWVMNTFYKNGAFIDTPPKEWEEHLKVVSPAYRLEDLLSKPFCEAIWGRMSTEIKATRKEKEPWMVQTDLATAYWDGGLPAVEKALLSLMKGGR